MPIFAHPLPNGQGQKLEFPPFGSIPNYFMLQRSVKVMATLKLYKFVLILLQLTFQPFANSSVMSYCARITRKLSSSVIGVHRSIGSVSELQKEAHFEKV